MFRRGSVNPLTDAARKSVRNRKEREEDTSASAAAQTTTVVENLEAFKAKYYGSVTVDNPQGVDVICQAALKVKQQNQPVVKVYVMILKREIKLIDRDTGDVIQNTPMGLVTFSAVDPSDKKQFAYITRSKAGPLYCHIFSVKERAGDIPRAISSAFNAIAHEIPPPAIAPGPISPPQRLASVNAGVGMPATPVHRQMSSPSAFGASPPVASPPGRSMSMSMGMGAAPSMAVGERQATILAPSPGETSASLPPFPTGTFDAFYLGHEVVKELMGNNVVKDAVKRNEEKRKEAQVRPRLLRVVC